MQCRKPNVVGSYALLLWTLVVTGCVSVRIERVHQGRHPRSSTEQYRSHIEFLAHDQLGGRGTGTNGIELAAGYIAGQFDAIGLLPGSDENTYFQDYEFVGGATLLDETKLEVSGASMPTTLREDFVPFGFSASGEFEGEVVFVGYGIVNPEKNHDDYAGIDISGRVALMLRREPPDWSAGRSTTHATFRSKMKLALDHGAVAVIIVNQEPDNGGADTLMRFRGGGQDFGLPAIHLKRSAAEQLLAAGQMKTLSDLQQQLDAATGTVSQTISGVRIFGLVSTERNMIHARNVVGVLPGNGPHADEYVVIGGHYDHLGTRRGQVYNGADDNASGTAGVIELARALSQTQQRDRSVIFMTFSGEELGLRGSRHYARNPTVDIDSIVAMINMDMIGRLSEEHANMLAIQGLGTGDSFKEIVAQRTEEAGIPYLPDESARGPSDHASFYEAGVPSLFFFTGVHSDYHQPGDDSPKVNVEGAVRIVNLVEHIALDIINADDQPRFAEVNQRANIFRGNRPGGDILVMGITPDLDDESDEPGWRIAEVAPDGGADQAGMKPGDRLIRIGGKTLNGFGDYREATRGKKAGDSVDVTVLRNKKEVNLKVKLERRRG